jgi:hypothetical protein
MGDNTESDTGQARILYLYALRSAQVRHGQSIIKQPCVNISSISTDKRKQMFQVRLGAAEGRDDVKSTLLTYQSISRL